MARQERYSAATIVGVIFEKPFRMSSSKGVCSWRPYRRWCLTTPKHFSIGFSSGLYVGRGMVVTPTEPNKEETSSQVSIAKCTAALSYTRTSPGTKKPISTESVRKVQKSCEELDCSLMSRSSGRWMSSPMRTVADMEAAWSEDCDTTLAGTPKGEMAYFRTRNSTSGQLC